MDEGEYDRFWQALITAERTVLRGFEEGAYFEGCLPVEVIAQRGRDTLRFGPMRPVGLRDPRSGRLPYAVVQLRRDNAAGDLMNLVGFQTGLRWRAQKEVLRLVPALARAEFARYGVMHKNAFVCAPKVLAIDTSLGSDAGVYLTGQMAGVEGYMESAALGQYTGIQVVRALRSLPPLPPPRTTLLGALVHYLVSAGADDFQPMNANFGLLPPLNENVRDKKQRKDRLTVRACRDLAEFLAATPVARPNPMC